MGIIWMIFQVFWFMLTCGVIRRRRFKCLHQHRRDFFPHWKIYKIEMELYKGFVHNKIQSILPALDNFQWKIRRVFSRINRGAQNIEADGNNKFYKSFVFISAYITYTYISNFINHYDINRILGEYNSYAVTLGYMLGYISSHLHINPYLLCKLFI